MIKQLQSSVHRNNHYTLFGYKPNKRKVWLNGHDSDPTQNKDCFLLRHTHSHALIHSHTYKCYLFSVVVSNNLTWKGAMQLDLLWIAYLLFLKKKKGKEEDCVDSEQEYYQNRHLNSGRGRKKQRNQPWQEHSNFANVMCASAWT